MNYLFFEFFVYHKCSIYAHTISQAQKVVATQSRTQFIYSIVDSVELF